MALDTYDNLKVEIAANLARSNITSASTEIDTFIDQAEAYINLKLRVLQMQDQSTVVTVGDVATSNLPTDYLEAVALTNRATPKELEFMSLPVFAQTSRYGEVGVPARWTVIRDNDNSRYKAQFDPVPDGAYTLDLTYYARIQALTSLVTSNWLLAEYPDIYLNGALYFAFRRFRNPLSADYKGLFDSDIDMLNDQSEKTFIGGSGFRQRIVGRTP